MGERTLTNCYLIKHIRKSCLCCIVISSCLPRLSFASLRQLNSLIQVFNVLIQFLCFRFCESFPRLPAVESQNRKRLAGSGIKKYAIDIQVKMLIYQLKADFDRKFLFGKITHHLDPEIRKMLVQRFHIPR